MFRLIWRPIQSNSSGIKEEANEVSLNQPFDDIFVGKIKGIIFRRDGRIFHLLILLLLLVPSNVLDFLHLHVLKIGFFIMLTNKPAAGKKRLSKPLGALVVLEKVITSHFYLSFIIPATLGAFFLQRIPPCLVAVRGDEIVGDMVGVKAPGLEVVCCFTEGIVRLRPLMDIIRNLLH